VATRCGDDAHVIRTGVNRCNITNVLTSTRLVPRPFLSTLYNARVFYLLLRPRHPLGQASACRFSPNPLIHMPTRSRSQASIDASKPKAPSRTASRTTVVSKSQESKTSTKKSKSRDATRPKLSASDTSDSPPPSLKRARSTTTLKEVNGLNGAAKTINKIKKADTVADVMPLPKKHRKAASVTESPINAVPEFPAKMVPPAQIFVWGTGNFGQFGMGPSFLDELSKPTRNTWVEEKITQGIFGSGPGSGIVGVVAGGLHSLFIDENGTVCSFLCDTLVPH
jgi:regulator of chromosome condensation